MKYKFRSLSSDSIERTIDILINNRVYLSNWKSFNDPHEGAFIPYCDPEMGLKLNGEYIVCCFSKDPRDYLLWAHYSDAFRGIAIGMEINGDNSSIVVDVEYGKVAEINGTESEDDQIKERLKYKHERWIYENEVRMIKRGKVGEFAKVDVKNVILGHKISQENASLIEGICKKYNYEIFMTSAYSIDKVSIDKRI